MLHICPRIHGQSFDELPFEEEILEFLRFLGHSAQIKTLTDVNINKLFQPWRSFGAVINKCLTGKSSSFDSFRLSQAQILWGLYHSRNIDNAFLIWEDFVYQVEHKNLKKSNKMYYPRFTKVIIHYFMSKDLSIPRQNKVNWHYVRDDIIFSTIKVKEKRSGSDTSITPPTAITTPTTTGAVTPRLTAAAKGKQPAKAKSPSDPSELARTEAQQLKIILRRSRQETYISQLGGSGTDEGTDADAQEKNRDDDEGDEKDESDDGEEDDDDERDDDDDEITKSDEESDDDETRKEESFDPIPRTTEDSEDNGNGEEYQGVKISEEERIYEEEEADELYRDVDINQGRGLKLYQDAEDSHMTLTPVYPDGQQESSSASSQFVTSMLNPTSDAGMESIFVTASSPVAHLQTSSPIMTPSTIATITTISHAPIPPTTIPSDVLQNLPTFDSVFRFEDRLKSLEANFSEYIQTNSFVEAVSNISGIVHQYMNQQINEAVQVAVQIQTDGLRDSYQRTSYAVAADLSEMELKKILIEKLEGNKSIQRSDEQRNLYKALVEVYEADKIILDTFGERVILKRRRDDDDDQGEGPSAGSDRGSERQREGKEPESASASLQTVTRSACRVDTLTPELLAGPTYELMKGSCNSLIELEYHLEEVYKATTDQLDWVNPEDYGNIKWIEDLVPYSMCIQEPINYDKHALWGVSHWGRKRQQFYGFAVNQESALDVYSKRRIIAVTDLKIVEWHSYKHLDWITVRRDDDKLYKFKEGDFKRLRLQDIEDMLLFLVQGKLSNLTVEERFAFNVSLRMLTRSIVIQRRVEYLQLGVESYQKRLNLTKPDTYWSDLKRQEAYTDYSNPRGFIYQNKDKKNRLMRIDELHKFSDGTLNDVCNALDDRLKGIRMQYLPQTIWKKGDKDRAAGMIQAIDKMLKTRRIMRSLERFVGERLYEGDFRMLQRTI
nr:hypothetical protein [Tanacetum cinerariifolium]